MKASSAASPVWFEPGPSRVIPGFIYGRRQASLLASVRLAAAMTSALGDLDPGERLRRLEQSWREAFGDERACPRARDPLSDWRGFVEWLGACAAALMRAADLAVSDTVRVFPDRAPGSAWTWTTVLLPMAPGMPAATREAWAIALRASGVALGAEHAAAARDAWQRGLEDLRQLAPRSANAPRFLRAALKKDIPVTPIALDVMQFGQGRRAQWLDSTFTLATPNLSAKLARDKRAAARRLRQAGLPVPVHRQVASAIDAVAAAREIGYPVVVKPADRDGGQGVAAGLETDEEVREAFAVARAASQRVLVEQHAPGRDYRLTVLDGELLWAIERVPASVVGDGVATVEALVERANADPRRGEGNHAPLKRLQIDAEAQRLLARQGLSAADVPAAGRLVRLRRIANVAAGGFPVAVMEQVHPDNARLAIRAALAMRLDLAGVDLLIPDIARSWRETGAAICEVNAQPQINPVTGSHLYGEILTRRLGGNGRIPVIGVIGDSREVSLVAEISDRLRSLGLAVGWSDRRGAGIDDDRILPAGGSTFEAGQMLLTDPRVDALVLGLHDDEPVRTGLPVDRIDWLVVASTDVAAANDPARAGALAEPPHAAVILRLLRAVLPACSERLVWLRGIDRQTMELAKSVHTRCSTKVMDRSDLLERVTGRWHRPEGGV